MRKTLFLTLIITAFVTTSMSLSFAEEMKGMMGEAKDGQEMPMGKGAMGGKMMGMHMMMKGMMEKSVVPTSDGGVVVVAGNNITKYDKNLKVVGEAEVKMNMEAMQKNMMEMMKKCPMMKGGMMNQTESADEGSSQPAGAATTSEHEAHH